MGAPWEKAVAGLLCGYGLLGCQTQENDVLREFEGPHLAAESSASRKTQRYVIGPEAELRVSLKSKTAQVSGSLTGLTGYLELSPLRLKSLRGELRVDVASLSIDSGPLAAETVLGWFANRQSSRRSRLLMARFVVNKVLETSVDALQLAPAKKGPQGPYAEARVRVLGDLELHGYRAEQQLELLLRVPLKKSVPEFGRLELKTARPAQISLDAHRIRAELPKEPGAAAKPIRTASAEATFSLRAVE